jgi:hypothetical protein
MPVEARRSTAEAAASFTEYYLMLINRTNTDMDSQYLRQLERACETCERLAAETDEDAASGYRYAGGRLTLDGDIKALITSAETAESAFVVDQETLQVVDSTGTPIPDLSFPMLNDLSSGSVATWDEDLDSWIMIELTLG